MLRFVIGIIFLALGTTAFGASRRALECAGHNPNVHGCNGYFRLYLFETTSGDVDKAMLYPTTVMNSSQTWTGEAAWSDDTLVGFRGENTAGGSVHLEIDLSQEQVLKVPRRSCLPASIRGLTGHPTKLEYVAVYRPYRRPEVHEEASLDIVCRQVK